MYLKTCCTPFHTFQGNMSFNLEMVAKLCTLFSDWVCTRLDFWWRLILASSCQTAPPFFLSQYGSAALMTHCWHLNIFYYWHWYICSVFVCWFLKAEDLKPHEWNSCFKSCMIFMLKNRVTIMNRRHSLSSNDQSLNSSESLVNPMRVLAWGPILWIHISVIILTALTSEAHCKLTCWLYLNCVVQSCADSMILKITHHGQIKVIIRL